jgi:hypothetical protein
LLNSLVFKFPRCHCKFLKKKKIRLIQYFLVAQMQVHEAWVKSNDALQTISVLLVRLSKYFLFPASLKFIECLESK